MMTNASLAPASPAHPSGTSARPALSVAHVVTPAAVGGLESALLLLAAGQARAGLQVHVLPTLLRPEASARWVERLREAGVQVNPIFGRGRDYLGEARGLTELCRSLSPSVVHTHGHRSDLLGLIAARRAGIPVVTTLHGFVGGDWKMRAYEWLQRRAIRRFDAVVAVSASMAQALRQRGLRAERLHVVPNAFRVVDQPLTREAARDALNVPRDGFRIGWIGRLSHEKGVDLAVTALADPRLEGAAMSVIGDGGDKEPARALAERLGVSGRLTWHGSLPSAARYVRAFDVLLLSSRTEGTPIVLFEAMAAEVPIVAARVGGVPDMLGPDQALLAPPERPAELAAAVAAVRSDPSAAAARALSARARLDRDYALEPWVDRYVSVYRAAARMPAGAASSP